MIVIGDVHGCIKTLEALLAKFPADQDVVFVGDLIDRGPGSAQVVELVKNKYMTVMGNHEMMMLSATEYDANNTLWVNWSEMRDWMRNGGEETLASYGISWKSNLPELLEDIRNNKLFMEHRAWIENLMPFLEYESVKNAEGRKLVVSHSSIDRVWDKRNSTNPNDLWILEQTALWGRVPNIMSIPDVYNIFGHTPHDDNPRIKSCYANIDTACCYVDYKIGGTLTSIQYPEMIVYTQENLDMPFPEVRK